MKSLTAETAKTAIAEYVVSITVAPRAVVNPTFRPPVKVFCNTRIAVGPMGTEAHTPIVKALRSSSNIIRAALRVLPSVNGPYFRNGM